MVVGQTSDLVMAVYCRGGGLSSGETGSWRPCIVSDLADVGVLFLPPSQDRALTVKRSWTSCRRLETGTEDRLRLRC